MTTTNTTTETNSTDDNNNSEAQEPKNQTLLGEVRQQILKDAERYFPSQLCPAHPQMVHAFQLAKTQYINDRIQRWKKTQTLQTSERCGRDLANQHDTGEREAGDMRAQSEPARAQAVDPSDPADVVPPNIQAAMDFMAKYQASRSDRAAQQADERNGLLLTALDPRSPLDHLPPEKQSILYEALCEFGAPDICAIITKPEPEGWGIETCNSSLKRFRVRYQKRTQAQKELELKQITVDLLNDADNADDGYVRASERLLKLRLLETVNKPDSKTSEVRDLYTTFTRLRAQALAEKRLALAERKQIPPPHGRRVQPEVLDITTANPTSSPGIYASTGVAGADTLTTD